MLPGAHWGVGILFKPITWFQLRLGNIILFLCVKKMGWKKTKYRVIGRITLRCFFSIYSKTILWTYHILKGASVHSFCHIRISPNVQQETNCYIFTKSAWHISFWWILKIKINSIVDVVWNILKFTPITGKKSVNFYYASIRSFSLHRVFSGCFFDIGSANSNWEHKLANQNNSFPLCPVRFYLSIEA